MNKTARLLIGFAGLSFIILFHELGHFLVAKLFGLETPIFSIGFGPALIKYTIGTTTFQFSALPLGGYVMFNPAELNTQPYLIQLAIALAGVVFNFILAYLIFIAMVLRGSYQTTNTIDYIVTDAPAAHAGLLANDIVTHFNNIPLKNTAKDFTHFAQTMAERPGEEVILTILRGDEPINVFLTLGKNHPMLGENIGWLGIAWKQEKIASASIFDAIADGLGMLKATLVNMGTLTAEIFSQGNKNQITGPIGILQGMARSLQFGSFYYAMSIALISLNVGIFNLLPLPFLDGGRIVQFSLESLFGPLPTSTIIILTLFIFFIFLQILGVLLRPENQL